MKPIKMQALALFFAFLIISACGCRPTAPAIAATPSPAPTWDQLFNRPSGWTGGDVAASIVIPGHRALWLFGDSFIGTVDGNRRVRPTLVNNAIAVHPHHPDDPARPPSPDQLAFSWGPPDFAGKPTAWLRPPPSAGADESWYWPTGGAVVTPGPDGPRLAVFLIRLRKMPGADGVWGFDCIGSELALIDHADEPVERWRPRILSLPHEFHRAGRPGEEIDWGVAALYEPKAGGCAAAAARDAGWVYIYGTRSDPTQRRDLLLARVRPAGLETFADWEFWTGAKWAAEPDQAAPLVANVASELSIDRVEDSAAAGCDRVREGNGRGVYYLMVSSEPFLGDHILTRTAPAPTGPWSGAREVFQVQRVGGSTGRFAYAAKGHLALSPPGSILISYIVNSNDLVDLLDPEIYRPRFLLVPLPKP